MSKASIEKPNVLIFTRGIKTVTRVVEFNREIGCI